jgi:hypothetical protein
MPFIRRSQHTIGGRASLARFAIILRSDLKNQRSSIASLDSTQPQGISVPNDESPTPETAIQRGADTTVDGLPYWMPGPPTEPTHVTGLRRCRLCCRRLNPYRARDSATSNHSAHQDWYRAVEAQAPSAHARRRLVSVGVWLQAWLLGPAVLARREDRVRVAVGRHVDARMFPPHTPVE